MRRLPVYFVIDVSESMIGEPIEMVQEGMAAIIKELRTDPYALETVFISIIVFAGKAQKTTPLIELYNFYPPKLPVGGGTALGTALNFLMDEIDTSVVKTTLESKGYWKPIIFLFTDGTPTDKYQSAFERWNAKYRNKTNLVAVSIGNAIDGKILGQITEDVLSLNKTDNESFKKFFKWITASIKTNSASICTTSTDDKMYLAPITNGFLSKIDLTKETTGVADDNFAIFLGKCSNTKRLYLLKYQKRLQPNEFGTKYFANTQDYKFVGGFQVDNAYLDLCDGSKLEAKVSTANLSGFPSCPCCGNAYGLCLCPCGAVICAGDESENKYGDTKPFVCPSCGRQLRMSSSGGSEFDITRTQG